MNNKILLRLVLIIFVLAFATLACGLFEGQDDYYEDTEEYAGYDDEALNAEQESNLEPTKQDDLSAEEDDEWVYYDLPEDCLDEEEYDPVAQLCVCIECDTTDDDLAGADAVGDDSSSAELQDYLESVWSEAQTESTTDFEGEEQRLVIYTISGDEIINPEFQDVSGDFAAFQQDSHTQQEIWVYFADLIPNENREMLTTYIVFTDGVDNTMAAVEQEPDNPEGWMLVVDIADAQNHKELTYTLIHEYGHLLTLNADQVEPDAALLADPEDEDLYYDAVDACPYYFPGEGCSLPNAYINAFYNRFWVEIYDEWQDLDTILDDDLYYDTLDGLYLKYQDQFVTAYAATNPEEDLAETWTYFVLMPKPEGDMIADDKVLFLYEYPELIVLREEIIAGTSSGLH